MASKKMHQYTQTISLKQLTFTTGTWTDNSNATVPYFSKAAAAETTTVTIPIKPPTLAGEIGVEVDKIEVPIRIATADLTGVMTGTLNLIHHSNAASGTNIDTASVTITESGTQVTNSATDRLYTCTVSTPGLNYSSTNPSLSYSFSLSIPCATTTALRVYEPTIYYTSAV